MANEAKNDGRDKRVIEAQAKRDRAVKAYNEAAAAVQEVSVAGGPAYYRARDARDALIAPRDAAIRECANVEAEFEKREPPEAERPSA